MELALNSAWAILAILGLIACLRTNSAEGRQSQSSRLVALAMIVLILFPVISVTDDIWAVRNPAEPDSCLRRDHLPAHQHTIVPETAMAVVVTQEEQLLTLSGSAMHQERLPRLLNPDPSFLFCRPPPAV